MSSSDFLPPCSFMMSFMQADSATVQGADLVSSTQSCNLLLVQFVGRIVMDYYHPDWLLAAFVSPGRPEASRPLHEHTTTNKTGKNARIHHR